MNKGLLLNALLRAEEGGYSTLLLNVFQNENSNDSAYLTALFYGIIERKYTLDYILSKYLDKDITKLNKTVLNVLRIGLYEALYMDSVPNFAAADNAVKLIKTTKFKYFSGLVNAVLRKAVNYDINNINNKPKTTKYSANEWIISEIVSSIGEENADYFFNDSFNTAPIFAVINSLKTKTLPENIFEKTDNEFIYKVLDYKDALKCLNNGECYFQDYSAASSILNSNIAENERILDICAAPGGKSFAAYIKTSGNAEITACDIYENRLKLINENSERLGFNIKTEISDASIFNSKLGVFDTVICDVPCTGTGTIRRKPEIKYKEESELSSIIPVQRSILLNAANYVKKGGKIIYSTCSLSNKENEENVKFFLQNYKNFSIFSEQKYHPKLNGGDGFYSCTLKRV